MNTCVDNIIQITNPPRNHAVSLNSNVQNIHENLEWQFADLIHSTVVSPPQASSGAPPSPKCEADVWVKKRSVIDEFFFLCSAFSAVENFKTKEIEELSIENMLSVDSGVPCV